ncbi:MAG: CRISPR-associated protein Csm4, partial [Dialister sp.]|nr:CRISPR-associated protein Csm4 [Dialister sp.]
MRSFYILPLHFTTPVHFGSAGYGGGLEMAGMTCPADTLFSALCVEAVRLGGDALAALTAKAERGDIAFSDLLPCRWEAGEWQWYLPKPVLSMPVKAE